MQYGIAQSPIDWMETVSAGIYLGEEEQSSDWPATGNASD